MVDKKIYSILLKMIFDERKKLIKYFIVSFFIFALISFLIPKRYQSTLKVFPNQNENNISSLGQLAQGFGLAGGNSSSFPISDIASSNLILDQIYYSSFETSEGEITNLKEILYRPILSFIQKKKEEELEKFLTLEKFKDRLSISYDRIANITSISVTLEDPNVAKQVLDLFYSELSLYINESINYAASYERNFIEKRILTVKNELSVAEGDVEAFLNENKSIQDSPLLLKRYNGFLRELAVKESAYIVLRQELEIAKINEVKNTLKIFILEEPKVAVKKNFPPRLLFSLSGSIISILIILYRMRRREIRQHFNF